MSKVYRADGSIYYWCQACETHHQIIVGRWTWNGDSEKPTFSPSILVTGVIRCHHYVRDGKIQYLDDCSHPMAGQTVAMEDFDGLRT